MLTVPSLSACSLTLLNIPDSRHVRTHTLLFGNNLTTPGISGRECAPFGQEINHCPARNRDKRAQKPATERGVVQDHQLIEELSFADRKCKSHINQLSALSCKTRWYNTPERYTGGITHLRGTPVGYSHHEVHPWVIHTLRYTQGLTVPRYTQWLTVPRGTPMG